MTRAMRHMFVLMSKKKKARLLSKLKVEEISGVDRGANPGAKVAFWKRDLTNDNQGDNNMDIEELAKRLEALEKSDSDNKETIEKLEAEKQELETLAKMSDAEKAYMDKMSDEEKKRFMGLDSKGRKEMMTKADEVAKAEEKAKEETVSKADFEAIRKEANELKAEIKKINDEKAFEAFKTDIAKRVPVLASEEKASVVKALHAMDEDARDAFVKELESAEKVKDKFAKEYGVVAKSESDPEAQLEALAKAHADKHNVTIQKAHAEVLNTAKGQELYSQIGKN